MSIVSSIKYFDVLISHYECVICSDRVRAFIIFQCLYHLLSNILNVEAMLEGIPLQSSIELN